MANHECKIGAIDVQKWTRYHKILDLPWIEYYSRGTGVLLQIYYIFLPSPDVIDATLDATLSWFSPIHHQHYHHLISFCLEFLPFFLNHICKSTPDPQMVHRIGIHFTLTLFLLLQLTDAAQKGKKNCRPGSFFNGLKCQICPAGTYQNKNSQTSCRNCPLGIFNEVQGIQGINVCRPCPSGTFSTKTGLTRETDSKLCPNKKSSTCGAISCVRCQPGTFITASRSQLNQRVSICRKCSTSVFGGVTKRPNMMECERCEGGITVPIKGGKACGRCKPGFQVERTGFQSCDEGKISYGSGKCMACPPGFVDADNIRCIPCPAGTYNFRTSLFGSCEKCGGNENTNSLGATFCKPDNVLCPPPFFADNTGTCRSCTRGERFDKDQKQCVPCPPDAEGHGALGTACNSCPPERVGSTNGCICRPGYETLPNGDCRICPKGTAQGPGGCFSCPGRLFTNEDGMVECRKCPDGQIANSKHTGCEVCPPGSCYEDDFGSLTNAPRSVDPRTNCPIGQERVISTSGAWDGCQPTSCPLGTFTFRKRFSFLRTRVRRCLFRAPGQFLNKKQGACDFCDRDSISPGGVVTECKKCSGNLSPERPLGGEPMRSLKCICTNKRFPYKGLINGNCVDCPPGTYGVDRGTVCRPCPAGLSSSGKNTIGFCRSCERGEIAIGSPPICTKCPPGSTSFGAGDLVCTSIVSED